MPRNVPMALDARLKAVYVKQVNISATTWFMLIDLDNEGGKYPHDGNAAGIFLGSVMSSVRKNLATDNWAFDLGVVLDTDSTEGIVAVFGSGTFDLQDSGLVASRELGISAPVTIDMTVVSNELVNAATTEIITAPAMKNTNTFNDIAGASRNPAVGDVFVRARRIAGAGTARFEYTLWYWAE